MKRFFLKVSAWKYKRIWRHFFFLFDSENIHNFFVSAGELFGRSSFIKYLLKKWWFVSGPALTQTVAGITFPNPIGLAAGFDYGAKLTQILPSLGFGFETIGTITNHAYEGNPEPRLGRLIKSRSLLVNKGFKNPGIDAILKKLEKSRFENPVGISIGATNSRNKKISQAEAVLDILEAFEKTADANLPFAYYELNISCPNLFADISFYEPERLRELLEGVTTLKLSKPLFVKMPIDKTDEETLQMLFVISSFPVTGIIFGNLQRNRQDPSLLPEEVAKHGKGNFSGKPTEKRSNELISLAYKHYGKRLKIIGCGGVFSANDAYVKIKNGASLVQLITGLIYEGPQLAGEINFDLLKLLENDGFKNIAEAVGANIS